MKCQNKGKGLQMNLKLRKAAELLSLLESVPHTLTPEEIHILTLEHSIFLSEEEINQIEQYFLMEYANKTKKFSSQLTLNLY